MDGIEFGEVEFRDPEPARRPDRDRRYCVVACGQVEPSQLPVFVDLDVMRDMEGHARSNVHVELGGVLLGGKFVDDDGQSFVVVKEALRARHYEATRGSFKFTHDTWARITRDREQFPAELQLVGWYHTHPDWGVFLSGMDTFICENFFADQLDVDLVIDPCRGDRGWFFWDQQDGVRTKQRLAGFYLFASRFRRTEVLQFARALSEVNPAYFDPRYETPMGESTMQPVVNIHDQKSPLLTLAVLGILAVQMLVLGLIAWRTLFPPPAAAGLAQQQRAGVYREILGQMVESSSAETGIIERVEQLADENRQLQLDLDGRSLLIEQLRNDNLRLTRSAENSQRSLNEKSATVASLNEEISELQEQLRTEQNVNADIKAGRPIGGMKWPWVTAIAVASGLVGLLAGTLVARHLSDEEEYSGSGTGQIEQLESPLSEYSDDDR
jgi:proteasome lid subunit RPN8/RPN11